MVWDRKGSAFAGVSGGNATGRVSEPAPAKARRRPGADPEFFRFSQLPCRHPTATLQIAPGPAIWSLQIILR